MQHYRERIIVDPDIMLGRPVIKGTRITVDLILKKLSEGMTTEDLLEAYPHLTREDILAALSYSADVISQEEMIAP
ncbi:MAG: antitoxin [Nitrospirae bacterium CG_4_10_14_0_8_um_filter_41_23]|nr:MAG: antitoxin [Nitrospirae bacterium CG11_big_fil_rev_8_21_14_0_20_41_14]PIV44838.1 MAG: antitoxin [Nitrospirae bacterium CG02_land_8_20_14_3_00_41_53]PIW86586.1 MAG: antitoxin [Nitrospirae bacterium CG_4_8_14_3_um_filter_41_47]PIY86694.1 MAG: antitoxin [Nitrospirae bacterium CG_4_10_14_0_8_um_filter_41_23]PJA80610.1 MAG: antitoxin [Nitrospirae bacterium CG_4_9_14_3_um_filter_41_27]